MACGSGAYAESGIAEHTSPQRQRRGRSSRVEGGTRRGPDQQRGRRNDSGNRRGLVAVVLLQRQLDSPGGTNSCTHVSLPERQHFGEDYTAKRANEQRRRLSQQVDFARFARRLNQRIIEIVTERSLAVSC